MPAFLGGIATILKTVVAIFPLHSLLKALEMPAFLGGIATMWYIYLINLVSIFT